MKGRKILKRVVVSFSEAAEIGKVENIFFDHQARIAALLIKDRGKHPEKLLATGVDNVHAVGRDAITIEQSAGLDDGGAVAELQEYPNLRQLVGCRVITENGIFLGTVRDLLIDTDDRRITDFKLSGRGVLGHLRGDTIPATGRLRFGKAIVIVPSTVALKGPAVLEQLAEPSPMVFPLAASHQAMSAIAPVAAPPATTGLRSDAEEGELTRAVGG